MVETQLCKLRGSSHAFVGRAYPIFHLQYGVCELRNVFLLILSFTNFFGRSFARVLYFIHVSVTPLVAAQGQQDDCSTEVQYVLVCFGALDEAHMVDVSTR